MPQRYRVAGGQPLRYLVSASPQAQAGERPPLLCFLHGYGEAAPRDIHRALTLHGPLRDGSAAAATRDFVVVAPQLLVGGDLWLRYADAVRAIVAAVAGECGCDPRRLYLTGFSFGGNGVLELGAAQPDLWAALWPVDPTRLPSRPFGAPVWLSVGEVSRGRAQQFAAALQLRPLDEDPAGDRLWHDDGRDHAGSAAAAYADERIYRWLLARTLRDAQ